MISPDKHGSRRSSKEAGKPIFGWILPAFLLTLFFLSGLLAVAQGKSVQAAEESNPRIVEKKFIIQSHHWQLAEWSDGSPVCEIYIEHSQTPTYDEVIEFCGYGVFQSWVDTPPCTDAAEGGSGASCEGLLNRYLGEIRYAYKKEVELPRIKVKATTLKCLPGAWCESNPAVKVIAYEPLSGYRITKVHVRIGGRENVYTGSDGQFPLPLTSEQGDWLIYWAESDYGDQSEQVAIKYRNYQPDPNTRFYRFDLLGPEWRAYTASGSLLWGIFPPTDRIMVKVLDQPLTEDYLHTTNRYIFLASHLIRTGLVDAGSCPNGGLYTDGSANPCGESAAAEQALNWQNRYDSQIYRAAKKYNIPARALKGIIAQETQFWPTSNTPYELGLGKITENGADLLLMWNLDYYFEVCPPIYSQVSCSAGYANLDPDQQTILRRTVLDKVGTPEEIDTLAALVYASAAQTNQMVRNTAQQEPSKVIDFEEMWKITIGNYYVGSGCISVGMQNLAASSPKYTWDGLVDQMVGDCKNAEQYVDQVMHSPE